MNQQYRAFFVIICTAVLHSMEQEPRKQIADIKKVIYAPEGKIITEIVFVQNDRLVINGYKKNNLGKLQNLYSPQLVDLETGSMIPFCSVEKGSFQSLTANSDKTKVALFKCGEGSHEVVVYDFVIEKKYVSKASIIHPADCDILFDSSTDTLFLYDMKGNHVVIDYVNNDAKLNGFLHYTADIGKPLSYFQKKKYYCASAWCVIDGLRMNDFKTCSVDELTKQGYVFNHVCESPDESFILFRATHDMQSLTHDDFKINRWYAVYVETKECIPLEHGCNHTWAACIHPNSKFVAIACVDSHIGRICYCCAKTGKLIAQQEYPRFFDQTSSLMNYWEPGGTLSNISFSADSTMLAAALSECVVFNVPFEVNYGVETKEKLAKMLLLLRNYKPIVLPEDIVRMLTLETMRVSKL
jgi:hypothetical protein